MRDLDSLIQLVEHRQTSLGDPSPADDGDVVDRVWRRLQHELANETGPAHAGQHGGEDRLGEAMPIPSDHADKKPGRSIRRGATLATAVAVLGGGTAAAAGFLASHTGEVNSGWQVQAGGPGENLRRDGSDFPQVLREATADIPFPADAARTRALASRDFSHDSGVLVSTGAARASAASWAVCSWVQEWATALPFDPARAATAAKVLDSAPTWPAVKAVDPNPSMTGYTDDQGENTPTQFGWLMPLLDGVHAGSVTQVVEASQTNGYCRPDQAPNLPWSSPEFQRMAATALAGGTK